MVADQRRVGIRACLRSLRVMVVGKVGQCARHFGVSTSVRWLALGH